MKVSIIIVSFKGHFPWLEQCLRSIEKYASGFHEVNICVPDEDASGAIRLRDGYHGAVPARVTGYIDWLDKPFMRHMDVIMHSDQYCPEADYVFHTDSDCIFIEPVKPEDYFVDGKPVLMHADYDWLCKIEPTIRCWQEASQRALGWLPPTEGMRRHGACHPRETYLLTRQCIERNTGKPISDFIREQQEAFPNGFAEFPTISAYAWRFLSSKYHWIDQEKQKRPKDKIFQMWGKGPLDVPQEIWHADQKITVIPNEIFAKYL